MSERSIRLLYINEELKKGNTVQVNRLAEKLGVSNKTIQRDLNMLGSYYDKCAYDDESTRKLVCCGKEKSYRLARK